MTVQELIDKLEKYPRDARVIIWLSEDAYSEFIYYPDVYEDEEGDIRIIPGDI